MSERRLFSTPKIGTHFILFFPFRTPRGNMWRSDSEACRWARVRRVMDSPMSLTSKARVVRDWVESGCRFPKE